MRRARRTTAFTLAAFVAASGQGACDAPLDDAREREIVSVLVEADESLILTRPALVADKYRSMAKDPFSFLRGSFPLFLHDARAGNVAPTSAFHVEAYPRSIGDAHVENFGTLRASDATFAIEPNDFDAADRYPYLWEVRRLGVAIVVAARQSNPTDEDARAAAAAEARSYARTFARAYADTIIAIRDSGERPRLTEAGASTVLEDAFDRSVRDEANRRELVERTIVTDGVRTLKRGGIDEDDPLNVYVDAPEIAWTAFDGTLARYRTTLLDPPPASFFVVKDATREFGAGVASIPRLRFALLVEGPTTSLDDDVILELKELADSPARPVAPPGPSSDSVGERVLDAARICWSRPDAEPLWGNSDLLGLPVQIKGDFDAFKTLRVHRLEEDRGTPEALDGMAHALGVVLASVHAGSESVDEGIVDTIADTIATDPDSFADEQADVCVAYADVVAADHARFVHALSTLGPTLGLEPGPDDALSTDMTALVGHPPSESP
ncbi:MAG: DUF2252 family protein [Polyangiaceae bacterium]|nr:DUF2252 family protein [Polyangiaceae bacterium]